MILFRIALAVHPVASLGYWIAQPRGFEVASRFFLEHQVVAPILFAVSAAGVAAAALKRLRTEWVAVGILCGFWISSSAVIVFVGTTVFSWPFWGLLAGSVALLVLAFRRVRPEPPALLTGGTVVGVVLAGLFWFATWAPPATTHPQATRPPTMPTGPLATQLEADGIRVSITGSTVESYSSGSITATLVMAATSGRSLLL